MPDMGFTSTRHCVLVVLLFHQLTSGQRLHPVDLSSVVCPGSAERSEVFISLRDLPAGSSDIPHVLTIFRSADSQVAVELELLDAQSIPVIEKRTLHLLGVSSHKDGHSGGPEKGRRLSLGSTGLHRGSLDGGISSRSSSSYSPRRRGYGVGGSRWSASGIGSYGIREPELLQGRYPGGFSKTDYGWSGAKALVAGSVLGYPMAACTFDERACHDNLAYKATKDALHMIKDADDAEHELDQCEIADTSNETQGDQTWKGSCKKCFENFPVHLCTVRFRPQKDLNRDDLMELGFIPSHHQSPLKLTISKVRGPDYTKEAICGSHKTSEASHPVVFVVLSSVDPLSEEE
eukprot:TRINITY_DN14571_c0_g1_i1.p1 TRINITY_DN14571_c0_g1~~TRINITY_DN14571_c0_g1_i1.p1  ORF type:complete len:362 (+),score=55.92 TRINITY_DN14571_c0_g1_i1:47-1087(+)